MISRYHGRSSPVSFFEIAETSRKVTSLRPQPCPELTLSRLIPQLRVSNGSHRWVGSNPEKAKITRRFGSIYLGMVVLCVWYFEHALLQLNNCHHILPEKINPLPYLFAEPHSLHSMSQFTTKILSFHDNVWKYAHLQCRHAWSQIATQDISSYSPESRVYLSSTDTDTLRKIDWQMWFYTHHIVQFIPVTNKGK